MTLELELARTPAGTLTGTVRVRGGVPQPFTGVMELVARLEQLFDQGQPPAVHTPGTTEP